jgi:hypothetical protein
VTQEVTICTKQKFVWLQEANSKLPQYRSHLTTVVEKKDRVFLEQHED